MYKSSGRYEHNKFLSIPYRQLGRMLLFALTFDTDFTKTVVNIVPFRTKGDSLLESPAGYFWRLGLSSRRKEERKEFLFSQKPFVKAICHIPNESCNSYDSRVCECRVRKLTSVSLRDV